MHDHGQRFDPLSTGRPGDYRANDDVDDAIVRLRSLVEWNRKRLAREIEGGGTMVVPRKTTGYVAVSR